MSDKGQNFFENLLPFVLMGIGIALFIWLVCIFIYIAIWGFILGGILWIAAMAKKYFFRPKPSHKKNRIIEHDDYRNK